jgi:hypothetical protein
MVKSTYIDIANGTMKTEELHLEEYLDRTMYCVYLRAVQPQPCQRMIKKKERMCGKDSKQAKQPSQRSNTEREKAGTWKSLSSPNYLT